MLCLLTVCTLTRVNRNEFMMNVSPKLGRYNQRVYHTTLLSPNPISSLTVQDNPSSDCTYLEAALHKNEVRQAMVWEIDI